MMGGKSNEDVLVHLAKIVHFSACLPILCQLPVYTRADMYTPGQIQVQVWSCLKAMIFLGCAL